MSPRSILGQSTSRPFDGKSTCRHRRQETHCRSGRQHLHYQSMEIQEVDSTSVQCSRFSRRRTDRKRLHMSQRSMCIHHLHIHKFRTFLNPNTEETSCCTSYLWLDRYPLAERRLHQCLHHARLDSWRHRLLKFRVRHLVRHHQRSQTLRNPTKARSTIAWKTLCAFHVGPRKAQQNTQRRR
jgi:hypothetical protein